MISNRAAPEFQKLVTIANRVAARFNGSRDTCILTLDQANKKDCPHSMRVGPPVVRISEKFWSEHGSILVQVDKCSVRFSPHPRQVGFANTGDARPSHWKPLADRIFRQMQKGDFNGEMYAI
jgi:hypothetical protein